MNKKELIKALLGYRMEDTPISRSTFHFIRFFINYLDKLDTSHYDKSEFFRIELYLPEIVADACEQFRTSTDPETVAISQAFRKELGSEFPNMTDLGQSSAIDQYSETIEIARMLAEVTDQKWVENEIKEYFLAQHKIIQQTFDKFLRQVYRKGMFKLVDECKERGMTGRFGETDLRTYIIMGRVMFTFARKIDKTKGEIFREGGQIYSNEDSISFVGEDNDFLALSAGTQSIHTDLRTGMDMIEDVIKGWPQQEIEQEKVFKADKDVKLDAVAAMEAAAENQKI